MEYYRNKSGDIGVLVSPGYGAGWSTWNQEELAYDKRVVEYWLSHKDDQKWMGEIASYEKNQTQIDAKEHFKSLGYDGVYFGGFKQIRLEFVPSGVPFRIDEYDGWENLHVASSDEFTTLM